ncbi:hypothetical protein [Izhakiella capsodis]|uniref:hypothetical protein n=1 Tax=Izhakiella capsodis TaxID=1367852 RepID=UPI000B84C308|nr:hypothetical protein [Izhakiella capsodis]
MSDFEKTVTRKAVRMRVEFEPLLSEMNQKLVELQRQESDGMLMLGRLEESCIGQLTNRM